jgi:hypothetical protein
MQRGGAINRRSVDVGFQRQQLTHGRAVAALGAVRNVTAGAGDRRACRALTRAPAAVASLEYFKTRRRCPT